MMIRFVGDADAIFGPCMSHKSRPQHFLLPHYASGCAQPLSRRAFREVTMQRLICGMGVRAWLRINLAQRFLIA